MMMMSLYYSGLVEDGVKLWVGEWWYTYLFGVSKAEDENNVYSIEVKHNDDGYDDEPTIKIVQQDDSEIAAIGITTATDNEDDEFIIVVDDDDVAVTIRLAKKTASTEDRKVY